MAWGSARTDVAPFAGPSTVVKFLLYSVPFFFFFFFPLFYFFMGFNKIDVFNIE